MEDEGIVDEIKTLEEAVYEVVCFLTCSYLSFNNLTTYDYFFAFDLLVYYYCVLKIANFVMLSILKLKGSKKKEMLNRLLTPALEMKELQEKYEFVFLLIFLHAFNDLKCDLTFSDREFDRLGYEKLIEMAYEKSKVGYFLAKWFITRSCCDNFIWILFTGKSAASLR